MEESLAAAPKHSPAGSESTGNTHSMCHISRAGRGRSISVLWEWIWFDCKGGNCTVCSHSSLQPLKGEEHKAQCAPIRDAARWEIQGPLCIQMATGARRAALSTKEATKWRFPSWPWMCLAPFSWSGLGRGTVWCLSSLTIAQCTPQTRPAWPCPPNTTIPRVLPQPCWPLPQTTPNVSHELNYSKYWQTPNPTKNYCHRNYYRDFPFLLEEHCTAEQGYSCFWGRREVCLSEMLVLSNSPVL